MRGARLQLYGGACATRPEVGEGVDTAAERSRRSLRTLKLELKYYPIHPGAPAIYGILHIYHGQGSWGFGSINMAAWAQTNIPMSKK